MNDDGSHSSEEEDQHKRSYHNLLERKRRDHIKDSFTALKNALPTFKAVGGVKPRASRAQILKHTADYIKKNIRQIREHERKKQYLARLEEEHRVLSLAIQNGNFEPAEEMFAEVTARMESEAEEEMLKQDPAYQSTQDDDQYGNSSPDSYAGDGDDECEDVMVDDDEREEIEDEGSRGGEEDEEFQVEGEEDEEFQGEGEEDEEFQGEGEEDEELQGEGEEDEEFQGEGEEDEEFQGVGEEDEEFQREEEIETIKVEECSDSEAFYNSDGDHSQNEEAGEIDVV